MVDGGEKRRREGQRREDRESVDSLIKDKKRRCGPVVSEDK